MTRARRYVLNGTEASDLVRLRLGRRPADVERLRRAELVDDAYELTETGAVVADLVYAAEREAMLGEPPYVVCPDLREVDRRRVPPTEEDL